VILSSLAQVDLVRATVGSDGYVRLANDVEDILTSLGGTCRLGLVDGRPTPMVGTLAAHFEVDCLVGTKNICRAIKGWRHDSYAFKHCEVGCVTTTPMHGVCLM
jgi:hypothetical protein